MPEDYLNIVTDCIAKARAKGADAADAMMIDAKDVNVRFRQGNTETIERAESKDLGLRVLVKGKGGFRQAIVSSNDMSKKAVDALVTRAVEMAKVAPIDPFVALAPKALLCTKPKALDLYDKREVHEDELIEIAQKAEEAAFSVKGVTNSEGSQADFTSSAVALAISNGFAQGYRSSSCAVSTSVIAGKGDKMETDYDVAIARHLADLKDPALVGKKAGQRAVARLNPKKIKSCKVPVIFDSRVATDLLSSFAAAINGASVARGTSFLKSKMGQQLFNKNVSIIDDPYRKRGIGSHPFDGEGVAGERLNVVENGKLTTWLMDLRSAKQLGLETTGHASRGTSGPPSPHSTNLYIEPGKQSVAELMKGMKRGLLITDAFGMGVSTITGDYSQGASGFWIENGEKAYPVSEITIAGHMLEMFKNMIPASDLEFNFGTNAPSMLIEEMTIAGV